MKKMIAALIIMTTVLSTILAAVPAALTTAELGSTWTHTAHVHYDAVISSRDGMNDYTRVTCTTDEKRDNPKINAISKFAAFYGWIAYKGAEIKAFSYKVGNGEKHAEGGFIWETEATVVISAKNMGGENGVRFKVFAPVQKGSQRVNIYAEYDDGTNEQIWAATVTVGTATDVEEEIIPPDTHTDPDPRPELQSPAPGMLNIVVDGGTEQVFARSGSTAKIAIKLVNNTSVSSVKVRAEWSGKLKLTDAVYDIYDENDKSALAYVPESWEECEGEVIFNWLSADDSYGGDRVFVTLTFEVSEDTVNGEFLPIVISAEPEDIYTGADSEVKANLISGGVDVRNYIRGDCNDDGKINNKDVVALFRYVSGSEKVSDETAYDFNEDGSVNNKDVAALFRYVSK